MVLKSVGVISEKSVKGEKTMEKRKNTSERVRALTEAGILIALAMMLSVIKFADLPYGGSVTAASMLPMLIISYRHGFKMGLFSGLVFGVLQQLISLKTISYATTWKAAVAIILLDYVMAYATTAVGTLFKKKGRGASGAILYSALLCCLLRYVCHVISGATVWAGISIPTRAALIYSFSYNATYMLPETVVLLAAAVYIVSLIDIDSKDPRRIAASGENVWAKLLLPLGGLFAACGVIFDTVKILPVLQNPESGEFDISLISTVNFTPIMIVSAVCTVLAVISFVAYALLSKAKTIRRK